MTRLALLPFVALVGCVDPLTPAATNGPEWEIKNVKGYVETAAGLPPDVVYGWGLVVVGDVAHWYECPTVDACGAVEHQRSKRDVLAVEDVGDVASGDGGTVRVLKLALAPGSKYVVPYANPAKAAGR